MIYYLTYLKDNIAQNYIGIDITRGIADKYLNELKDIIGDDFDTYTRNQQDRDHNSHHITVMNVMEYNALSKSMGMDKLVNSLDQIFKYEIDDLKMLGIGTATRNNNRAYFIVCQSDKLDAIRNRYNLPKQDFHITLGFLHKDVFGVPKNVVIDKKTKFIKLLKIEYYKNDNWNFLKKIDNFDLNPQAEIIPISISDDKMKIKCDGYYMDISLMENEKFWIVTKYPIDKEEDLPRLPETEISKILNKK